MGILDFIKNRGSQEQQVADQPKPETAKELYTREASQDRASPSLTSMSQESKSRAAEIGKELQNSMQSPQQSSPSSPSPEGATNPQPMAQLGMNEEKAAPALSPTTAQAGTRQHEQEVGAPAPTPTQSPAPSRPSPSWER